MVDKVYDKIEVEEPMQVVSPKSGQPTSCKNNCIKTSVEKKQWQVMVISDSFLKGTEAPICRPHHLFSEKFPASLGSESGMTDKLSTAFRLLPTPALSCGY